MSKLRVACFAVSLDGFGAGPHQSLENPLGVGGMGLHQWFFPTRTFQKTVLGKDEGATGLPERARFSQRVLQIEQLARRVGRED